MIHGVDQQWRDEVNVPEKHRELAHAWVDGAVIQCIDKSDPKDIWENVNPSWIEEVDYRIDPKCDYAIAKIPEKHREVYLAWCDGAEVEGLLTKTMNQEYWYPLNEKTVKDMQEIWCDEYEIRIKPKKVKRWNWLVRGSKSIHTTGEKYTASQAKWLYGDFLIQPIPETEQEFDA